jgi:hypothetical protein
VGGLSGSRARWLDGLKGRSCRDEPGAEKGPGGGNEGAGGGLCRGTVVSFSHVYCIIIPEGLAVVVVPAAAGLSG